MGDKDRRTVKPAGKDSVEMRKPGSSNKVAKFDQRLARYGGEFRRWAERSQQDRNRKP